MSDDKTTKAKKTDWTDAVWKFFTSLKLVIFLLLILSVLSIAGTIIQQNKPLHEYYRYYKPETVALFSKLGLLDMYHSWWFIACLALLALNIIACTMDRYGAVMAGIRRKNLIIDGNLEKSLNPMEKIKYALPFDTVEKKVLEVVGKSFSRKPVLTAGADESRHYFFEKGKYSRLAFFVTHLSVLVIFLGAIVGSFFGYKGYVNIYEGQSITRVETRAGKVKDLGFSVKCYSFSAEFYPDGMPKDYRSDLAVIIDGKEAMRKTIRVNDPLTYRGVTFYQSSYGSLPDRAHIDVLNRDGSLRGTVEAAFGVRVEIPGTTDKLEAADYQDHFHLPDGSEGGAALGVNVYPDMGNPRGLWLPEKITDYDKLRGGDYYLRARDVKLKKYTGLQVNKDPGEALVWLGCILLVAGIMAAFFVSHKKLWIALRKDKKGRVDMTMGGMTNKNREAFLRETGRLIQSLKEVS